MAIQAISIPPRAVVDDHEIVIHDMVVTATEAVQTARAYAERSNQTDVGPHVEALIDIGGKAVAIGSSTVDVDEIKRSLDRFTTDLTATAHASVKDLRTAVEQATDTDTGTIARCVSQAIDELARAINEVVQGEDAPVRMAIGQTVKDLTDKALGEIQRALTAHQGAVRSLLSTDAADSPLNTLKRELLDGERDTREDIKVRLDEIKTLVEVAREHRVTMSKTAIKGMAYEDAVVASLVALAHGAGDRVEPTGSIVGCMPRCKAGDAVITLADPASRGHVIKVAVEAKDARLTCERWRIELEVARKNREAVAAIGVARSVEHIPGHQRVFILDPLHIVVAFDPKEDEEWVLYTIYHVVRAQAAAVVLVGETQAFDVVALQKKLSKARELLTDFDKLDKAVLGARSQLDTIDKTSDRLRDNLTTVLDEAAAILASAGE
jgi:hypothetical protein